MSIAMKALAELLCDYRTGYLLCCELQCPHSLVSALAYDFARLLIFAQTEKYRLTQFPISRPLREFDLRNENGIEPMHFAHHAGRDALHPLPAL